MPISDWEWGGSSIQGAEVVNQMKAPVLRPFAVLLQSKVRNSHTRFMANLFKIEEGQGRGKK